jgi:hypothetical protein
MVFVVGLCATRAKDGWIAELENPVDVEKEKNERDIRHVVPPKACATIANVIKKAVNVSVGKKALLQNN